MRLTEEFRLLPRNHRAKEDKLEVYALILLYIVTLIRYVFFGNILATSNNDASKH